MTDNAASVEIQSAPNGVRQIRETAGLPLATLAAMLKVSTEKLRALEEGRYQDLPDLNFARALALSVCRVLKVDSTAVLQSLPHASEVRLGLNAPVAEAKFSSHSSARHTSSVSTGAGAFSKPVTLSAAVLVLAVVLWWGLPLLQQQTQPQAVQQLAVEAPPEVNAVPVESAGSAGSQAVEQSTSAPAQSTAAPLAAVDAKPTDSKLPEKPAAEKTPDKAPLPDAPEVLRLSAREVTWVQVNEAGGKLLLQRQLKAGESVAFNAGMPLAVVVGRVDGVEVQVKGQAFDLAGLARNNVARFEVR